MKSMLGMNAHIPDIMTLDKIREARIEWIRCDFNWYMIEPQKGEFHWDALDRVVDYCQREGINILATIGYTPVWADGGSNHNRPSMNVDNWINFVYTVVNRYHPSVKHWAIWNEPNDEKFFSGSLKDYGERVLATASDAIRDIDPLLSIIAPSINTNRMNWTVWLKEMEWYALQNYFDILAIQLYKYPAEDVIKAIEKGKSWGWLFPWRRAIKKYIQKIGKPCWITETGWCTHHVSPDTQTDYYETVYEYVKESALIDRVFFYEMKDEVRTIDNFGILYSNYKPKSAYKYVKSLW